jgi:hypothetical protein
MREHSVGIRMTVRERRERESGLKSERERRRERGK